MDCMRWTKWRCLDANTMFSWWKRVTQKNMYFFLQPWLLIQQLRALKKPHKISSGSLGNSLPSASQRLCVRSAPTGKKLLYFSRCCSHHSCYQCLHPCLLGCTPRVSPTGFLLEQISLHPTVPTPLRCCSQEDTSRWVSWQLPSHTLKKTSTFV